LNSDASSRSSQRFSPVSGLLIAVTIILLGSAPAWAHKVNVFAYVEGRKVVVEGYFSGSVKAQNSTVQVLDSDGKILLEGKTDTGGIYSFSLEELPPTQGDIVIILDGGMGHKADFTLRAADLPESSRQKQTAPPTKSEEKETARILSTATSPSLQDQEPAQLRKMLEEILDRKIQPLVKMVSNQERLLMEQKDKGPSVTEIIGGIGWILGIVGVAGYFMGRGRKTQN
jgi:nickel transport protein